LARKAASFDSLLDLRGGCGSKTKGSKLVARKNSIQRGYRNEIEWSWEGAFRSFDGLKGVGKEVVFSVQLGPRRVGGGKRKS